MADTSQTLPTQAKKSAAKKRSPYLGVTRDGVKIIRPKFSPKSFTERELQEAVAKALGKSA